MSDDEQPTRDLGEVQFDGMDMPAPSSSMSGMNSVQSGFEMEMKMTRDRDRSLKESEEGPVSIGDQSFREKPRFVIPQPQVKHVASGKVVDMTKGKIKKTKDPKAERAKEIKCPAGKLCGGISGSVKKCPAGAYCTYNADMRTLKRKRKEEKKKHKLEKRAQKRSLQGDGDSNSSDEMAPRVFPPVPQLYKVEGGDDPLAEFCSLLASKLKERADIEEGS